MPAQKLKKLLDDDSNLQGLLPGDHLSLKLIPRYQEKLTVTLKGEVKFPGEYEFSRGETLSQIIKRAGGLTELAHVDASFFSRLDLKIKEAQQIEQDSSSVAACELSAL